MKQDYHKNFFTAVKTAATLPISLILSSVLRSARLLVPLCEKCSWLKTPGWRLPEMRRKPFPGLVTGLRFIRLLRS